jgi:murein DD-endopeptidase MepM/ murein hydrolase activator NlpD
LKGHDGIDCRTRFVDSPLGHRYITAAADGECEVRLDGASGYGNHVRIHHPDGSLTIYGHLDKAYVWNKEKVLAGQRIGLSDNSGFSSGPHLHFEYRPPNCDVHNGYAGAVDPLPFMVPLAGVTQIISLG